MHTNYRVLKLAGLVQVEEVASAESKDHAFVVLLKLVVDFGGDESGELAVGEGFIFVESLTADRVRVSTTGLLCGSHDIDVF